MTAFASGLYRGVVTHRRFWPKIHDLRYSVFQMLLNVDELPALGRKLRLFSYNRPNILSHHDCDHGDGRSQPLRAYVEATLREGGMPIHGGRIELLCMPRIFGFVFNPLSIYYCYDQDDVLTAILYEVNNTFGQRHNYLIEVDPASGRSIRQSCAKNFHVSPFMPMDVTYDFAMTAPGDTVATTVHGRGMDGALIITATFAGRRAEITDAALVRALVVYPLMTFKVVGAIHLEALKLWLKGVQLRPPPKAPLDSVTVVPARFAPALGLHKTDKQSA